VSILTPEPSADHHAALLEAFLTPGQSLFDLARSFGLTIFGLMEWLESDRTRSDLARLSAANHLRAAAIAQAALPAAAQTLARLDELLARTLLPEETPLPVRLRLADTQRKTTTTLQRLAGPRPKPSPTPRRLRDGPPLSAAA
jgi:hypothetical protein